MSLQGFTRLLFIAAVLGPMAGCASVPPVPERVRNNPDYLASKNSDSDGWLYDRLTGKSRAAAKQADAPPPPGSRTGVIPTSATEPIDANAPPPAAAATGVTGAAAGSALPPVTAPMYSPWKAPSAEEDLPPKDEKKGFEWSDLAPENVWKDAKKVAGFGPDQKIAQTAFQEGLALFRDKKYAEAAPKFKTASWRWPDSMLEEDSMFLLGESYFFSDQYAKAHDAYGELLKKHDNSRYLDTVVRREFALGRYWEEMHKASPHWPTTPNVSDKSRPLFDTFGHALDAYQRVRMYDPTGPLADDSVMATANAYFVKGEYESAAYNYDLLRKEYPTSEFQAQAHLLGLQAKLKVYQGKDYDGVPLTEADEIAQQTLTQFGRQLGPEKSRVEQTAKEIVEKKAERDWAMGQYFEKKRHYGSARFYYNSLMAEYPSTRHAEMARARLAEIRDKPDVPPNHFKWLTQLFPDEDRYR